MSYLAVSGATSREVGSQDVAGTVDSSEGLFGQEDLST